MNRWVQRGLRTALLTGGLLAAGAGVASADENDLSADVLGVTATVPVREDATVGTPVVTGAGGDLTVGGDDGLALPIDTDTEPGTTALGQDGTGGISVPVRVTEATDAPPDPGDGLTVTVPVNTSGGGTAGTTGTAPVVTGDLGGVLDGDPTSGLDVDVDLADPVVPGPDGSGVLLDLEDTVTIGDVDGATSPDTVLEVPVSLEDDRPTTVALPLPGGPGRGPLSGDDVDVRVGDLLGDGGAAADRPGPGEPDLSLPIDTGTALSDLLGGDTLTGTTVDLDLGGVLGGGPGNGSVVAVPVDQGGTGTASDVLVRATLPLDPSGLPGRDGTGNGNGAGRAPSGGPAGPGTGSGVDHRDGQGAGTGHGATDGGAGRHDSVPGGEGAGCAGTGTAAEWSAWAGTPSAGAAGTAAGGSGADRSGAHGSGDACGTGSPQAVTARPSSSATPRGPAVPAAAGALALVAGLLLAAGRGRLWRDPS
ncbi:hypothetical protein [Geodermatophilus sp. SYSU D01176]